MQNRTEQNRTEQNRTEQNRTEQNRTEQNSIYLNRGNFNRINSLLVYYINSFQKEIIFSALILLGVLFINLAINNSLDHLGKLRDLIFTFLNISLSLYILKKYKTPFIYSISTIFIYLIPILIIYLFDKRLITPSSSSKYLYFIVNICIFIFAFNTLIGLKNYFIRHIFFIFNIILLCIPISYIFYFCTSSSIIISDTLLALIQTNLSESKEFLWDNFNYMYFIFISIVMLLYILFIKFQTNTAHRSPIIFILLISSLFITYKTNNNLVLAPFYDSYEGFQEYKKLSKLSQHRAVMFSNNTIKKQGESGLFVFIIGESQNKLHMNAYGYNKNTTPWLSSVKNNTNFIIFQHAYSNHTHTVPVLSQVLTSKNQYNNNLIVNSPSIIDIANAAGYQTFWISNQVKLGAWDTPTSVIADQAHYQFWQNKNTGKTTKTNKFDGNLLDSIKKLDLSKNKIFIVIHLMGNHGSYRERYPEKFNIFHDKVTGAYDNSILYNDHVMQNIYEYFSKLKHFKAMIYMADHADAVTKKLGHDSSRFDFDMTRIPVWLTFSQDYFANRAENIQNLQKRRNIPFTNDLMFDLLLGLLGIHDTSYYDKKFDLCSPSFSLNPSKLKTLHGKKYILDDPLLTSQFN